MKRISYLLIGFVIFFFSCTNKKKVDYELIPVKLSDKWGLINHKGDFVISEQFNEVKYNFINGIFTDGLLCYSNSENKKGYIDKTGRIIINAKYHSATSFKDGFAIVTEDDSYLKIIDTKGNLVKELVDIEACGLFYDGLALILKNDKRGFIDNKGNIIINPIYSLASNFHDGLACVSETDLKKSKEIWGIIDKTGKYINSLRFDELSSKGFSKEGLLKAKEGKLWGYINKSGNYVINPQYEDCEDFHDGLAKVKKDGKYGYINIKNEFIIKAQFIQGENFINNFAKVKIENEKYGIIDKSGKYVIQPIYNDITNFFNDIAFYKIDSLWGIIDLKENIILNPKIKQVDFYSPDDAMDISLHFDCNSIIKNLLTNSNSTNFRGVNKESTVYDIKNYIINSDNSFIDETYKIVDNTNVYLGDGVKISSEQYTFNYPLANQQNDKFNIIRNTFYTINTGYVGMLKWNIDVLAETLIKELSKNSENVNIEELNPIDFKLDNSWEMKSIKSNDLKYILVYRNYIPSELNIQILF